MRPTLRTVDAVVDAIVEAAASVPRLIVGITGAPGAGKSTIAEAVVARLGSAAALLPMDGFHLPQATLVARGARERMGAPDTFDVDGFVETLTAVRAAASDVHAPGFDRSVEEPVPRAIVIPAATRIVVVEGNYLLHDAGGWERVAPLLDVALDVEIDDDVRRARLIARHVRFGKSETDARAWATGPDDANARLIAQARRRAGAIIALAAESDPATAPAASSPAG
jgi:pantothenate kinase